MSVALNDTYKLAKHLAEKVKMRRMSSNLKRQQQQNNMRRKNLRSDDQKSIYGVKNFISNGNYDQLNRVDQHFIMLAQSMKKN